MTETQKKMSKTNFNLRSLRLSLKYRPKILRLILKMRQCIMKKNSMLSKLKHQLKEMERTNDGLIVKNVDSSSKNLDKEINDSEVLSVEAQVTNATSQSSTPTANTGSTLKKPETKNISIQTDNVSNSSNGVSEEVPQDSGWKVNDENETKSIAEQVKEVAQKAMVQSGMVYVEAAGMYYDYKTGYYYNSELGLYYHTDTECYYYYDDEQKTFVFHSYPDRSVTAAQASLEAHNKKKAKKHKLDKKAEEDIDNLTKNLSQDGEDNDEGKKPKRKKKKKTKKDVSSPKENKEDIFPSSEEANSEITAEDKEDEKEVAEKEEKSVKPEELEDGECSDTSSEDASSDEEDNKSVKSTSTATDDESIAKHHPPCMRVIVRETSLPKLRVGTLFIVTKDGGSIGREGDQHVILLKDSNVSRNHMEIRYDTPRKAYLATDLGSKNGSILNGIRMSDSQTMSNPKEIVHGSILQIGETKLLCHIHPGNDTCGHCEPGLLMEALEKEKKVAYTRTCSVKRQHELELARLKNKYGAKPMLAIEETAYNDRAQARRETVGSSHHSEKTQSTDIETSIAPDNKGFKLLEKMGWNKGEGLGKDCQGETEPVPLISNAGKTGLGAAPLPFNPTNTLGTATMRLAARSKLLKPPAKAFQGPLDEDDSE